MKLSTNFPEGIFLLIHTIEFCSRLTVVTNNSRKFLCPAFCDPFCRPQYCLSLQSEVTSGETPHYIHSLFTRSTSRYASDNFIPPRPRMDLYKTSVAFSGSKPGNSRLPSKIFDSSNALKETYIKTWVPANLWTVSVVSYWQECIHSHCARISVILAQSLRICAHFTYITFLLLLLCCFLTDMYRSVSVFARTICV